MNYVHKLYIGLCTLVDGCSRRVAIEIKTMGLVRIWCVWGWWYQTVLCHTAICIGLYQARSMLGEAYIVQGACEILYNCHQTNVLLWLSILSWLMKSWDEISWISWSFFHPMRRDETRHFWYRRKIMRRDTILSGASWYFTNNARSKHKIPQSERNSQTDWPILVSRFGHFSSRLTCTTSLSSIIRVEE